MFLVCSTEERILPEQKRNSTSQLISVVRFPFWIFSNPISFHWCFSCGLKDILELSLHPAKSVYIYSLGLLLHPF